MTETTILKYEKGDKDMSEQKSTIKVSFTGVANEDIEAMLMMIEEIGNEYQCQCNFIINETEKVEKTEFDKKIDEYRDKVLEVASLYVEQLKRKFEDTSYILTNEDIEKIRMIGHITSTLQKLTKDNSKTTVINTVYEN